ncbi:MULTISPECIES: MBL fold metallo-hydrolase [Prevotellaceae]|uniref:MBL fold metallo-hydrolase n=1 Tax=Prevotellaceae TaxID=171552 RepID=UPI0003D37CD0|nr:MBL fold metallo-hydrolase [Prevotella phocaeensis]ETD21520.1 hypothetical protein HMPREF1199_00594 [Hoylesella oralis CC98A]
MLKFISFGSGSSGNCYCLFTENDGLMIDSGVGIRILKKHFREYGLSLSAIHHILITHDHADHVKSVGSISRDYNLPVYATHKVHVGIEQNYCVRNKIAPECVEIIEKDVAIQVGEFIVTPFEVPHDSSDNVGYKIEHGGITFCLITDAGHLTEEMKQSIGEANYLVIEANHDEEMLASGPYPQHLQTRISGPTGHLSNSDCATALTENVTEHLRHVWLCHLSGENNHPELARKTVENMLRSHGIIAGKDFLLDVLKRKTPSLLYDLE